MRDRAGVVTGFLGPNGAGRSTTMRMIVGLDRPTAGTATIGGHSYHNRTPVLSAKAAMAAALAGVFAAVLVIASIAVARALADQQVGARLSLTHAEAWRPVGAVGLYAALGAVLAVGLAVLLRYAAAVVAVLLLMPFVIEPLTGSAPRVGEHVGRLLPFTNAYEFTGMPWITGFPLWWGPLGALVFTGVVAAVFLAAVFVINRRDP